MVRFIQRTVHFDPWLSILTQKIVHFRPGPSSLTQMTVQFGSRPSTRFWPPVSNFIQLKTREQVTCEIPRIRLTDRSQCCSCANFKDYYQQAMESNREKNSEISLLQIKNHELKTELEKMKNERNKIKRSLLEQEDINRKMDLERQKAEKKQEIFTKILDQLSIP